jgi:nuclear pore complex protein Nup98-Nup96
MAKRSVVALFVQSCATDKTAHQISKRDDALRLLEFQLDQTSFDSDSGVPVAETRTTTKFSDFTELYLGQNDHEAELWRLARALFDDLPVLANEVVEGEIHVDADSLVRKTAFSDWLTNNLAATIDREVLNKDVGPRAVFTLLSGNQVIRATNLAVDSGDLRLASLVAQAGSGQDFRHLLQQQLDTWAQQHVDDHIDVTYRKIYALLAGIVREIEDEPSSSRLCITEGLSWLQALGLHLWYGTPLEQPLIDVISDYQAHLQSSRPPSSPVFAQGDVEDAMYGLLKVFAAQATPIEALLDPGAFGRASIDYRIQWHLLNMLINVLGIGADEAHILESVRTFDRLSVNYATQLEAAGLWPYAILILLHLDKECS